MGFRFVAALAVMLMMFSAYASTKAHYYAFDKTDRNKFVHWIMAMYISAAVLTGVVMVTMLLLQEGIL